MPYENANIETIARGVCLRAGHLLLCLPAKGGRSYLPGGHIEFGETGRRALVREIKEELGLDATSPTCRRPPPPLPPRKAGSPSVGCPSTRPPSPRPTCSPPISCATCPASSTPPGNSSAETTEATQKPRHTKSQQALARKEKKEGSTSGRPRIMWSRIGILSTRPARINVRVVSMSAVLGRTSPLGWLWTT